MKLKEHDKFGLELLRAYETCVSRDGSEAFDSLTSIHQYYLLYDLIKQYVPQGAIVLDWGSGSGHFTYFLIQAGYKPTSFGFYEPGLFQGGVFEEKLNFVFGRSDEPTKLPFSDGQYDAVTSVGVLEHVREFGGTEEGSLLEIHRVLKENGVFVCYHFPNKWSWIEFIARLSGKWSHQYLYDRADVNALFNHDLWDILECNRYAVLPRNILGRLLRGGLRNSPTISRLFDITDSFLSFFLRPFAQNWLVVARKR